MLPDVIPLTTNRISRDHEQNSLIFRGYTLEQLWDADFEDMFHLLMWGTYPSEIQRVDLSRKLAQHMKLVPNAVHEAIHLLPYDHVYILFLLTEQDRDSF
jgi:citrate synthase